MSDLTIFPAPPLINLADYENVPPEKIRETIKSLATIRATCSDPVDIVDINKAAKALGYDIAPFKVIWGPIQKELAKDAKDKAQAIREAEAAQTVSLGGKSPLFFSDKGYYREVEGDRYGKICREDALMHLAINGFNRKSEDGEPSSAELALFDIQTKNYVTYAGPVCGRKPGVYEENQTRILCTDGPRFIEGVKGEFPAILSYIRGFLGEGAGDETTPLQFSLLVQWIRLGRVALRNTDRHLPGHVLTIVGEVNCGKTLFQTTILTPSFGGRVADPGQWVKGETTFNDGEWGAEHLCMGDSQTTGKVTDRDTVRDTLKEMIASTSYPLHPKGGVKRTFRPIWRISITANDDPLSISQIPGVGGGFADKTIILKAYAPRKPLWDEASPTGRSDFEDTLKRELPAFLHYVDSTPCPPELYKGRFGVTEWHHPAIIKAIYGTDPDCYLSEILREWYEGQKLSMDSDLKKAGKIRRSTKELWGLLNADQALTSGRVCASMVSLGKALITLSTKPEWGKIMRREFRGSAQVWAFYWEDQND